MLCTKAIQPEAPLLLLLLDDMSRTIHCTPDPTGTKFPSSIRMVASKVSGSARARYRPDKSCTPTPASLPSSYETAFFTCSLTPSAAFFSSSLLASSAFAFEPSTLDLYDRIRVTWTVPTMARQKFTAANLFDQTDV
jgi:hypothetical protein